MLFSSISRLHWGRRLREVGDRAGNDVANCAEYVLPHFVV